MEKLKKNSEWFFWTTIVVSLVLLIHNGLEPLFLFALAAIPVLALYFCHKQSFLLIGLYLIFVGIVGRYTQYHQSGYGSDVLPVIKDFIGYLLAGKNPYQELVMSQKGPTPFIYLPFALIWYLPARILNVDLRFFEMLISCFVPIQIFIYGLLTDRLKILPSLAIVSLTPFLIDLSADGSNDNSAIFLLLLSIILFVYSLRKKNRSLTILSAIFLGLASSFKHYVLFYLIFFLLYFFKNKVKLSVSGLKYQLIVLTTFVVISTPFVVASPDGFFQSLAYIETRPNHPIWGWNIWLALKNLLNFTLSFQQISIIRPVGTILALIGAIKIIKIDSFQKVFIGASLTLLTYLVLSPWTTHAYFTFLIPLLCLGAIEVKKT